MNKVKTYKEYLTLVESYNRIKIFSNDYIQHQANYIIDKGLMYEIHTKSNLFILVDKPVGMRIYYYIGNLEEMPVFSTDTNFVIEILYRGDTKFPKEEVDYFKTCGFSINLIRDQYSGLYKDINLCGIDSNISVQCASSISEVEMACDLFNNTFDSLSGDFLPKSCYDDLLASNQLIIAKDIHGRFLGALHQTFDKGTAWISHVAVMPEYRGQKIGKTIVQVFINNNYTSERQRYMLWVQRQNERAVSLYKKLGFKYINKSTISLIK